MKKVYEKPYAYVETFELNQHIASCEFIIRNNTDPSADGCYAEASDSLYGDAKLFFSGKTECQAYESSACAYTSTDGLPVFNSY